MLYHVIVCDIILWVPFIWMLKNLRLQVRVISFGCQPTTSQPQLWLNSQLFLKKSPSPSGKTSMFFAGVMPATRAKSFRPTRAKIHAPHGSKVSKSDPKKTSIESSKRSEMYGKLGLKQSKWLALINQTGDSITQPERTFNRQKTEAKGGNPKCGWDVSQIKQRSHQKYMRCTAKMVELCEIDTDKTKIYSAAQVLCSCSSWDLQYGKVASRSSMFSRNQRSGKSPHHHVQLYNW